MFGLVGKFLIGLLLSYVAFLLQPKPQPPKPGTLDDFDIPRAEEGRPIGKVFGTIRITDPTVHWYGDLKTSAIKSKTGKK